MCLFWDELSSWRDPAEVERTRRQYLIGVKNRYRQKRQSHVDRELERAFLEFTEPARRLSGALRKEDNGGAVDYLFSRGVYRGYGLFVI
jgi:hypothetical protein